MVTRLNSVEFSYFHADRNDKARGISDCYAYYLLFFSEPVAPPRRGCRLASFQERTFFDDDYDHR